MAEQIPSKVELSTEQVITDTCAVAQQETDSKAKLAARQYSRGLVLSRTAPATDRPTSTSTTIQDTDQVTAMINFMKRILLAGLLLISLAAFVESQERPPQQLLRAAQCLAVKKFLPPAKAPQITFGYLLDDKSYHQCGRICHRANIHYHQHIQFQWSRPIRPAKLPKRYNRA